MSKKVIILDRDGVINHDSDHYIKSPDEWQVIDGVPEAIARLNKAGYTCVIATNQSGIGRGLYSLDVFLKITQKMNQTLADSHAKIDFLLYCPHIPEDNCDCRKPKAGMLNEAAKRLRVDAETIYFVGDSITDIKAAKNAKMKPILLKTGKGERTIAGGYDDLDDVPIYKSLADFTDNLLENTR